MAGFRTIVVNNRTWKWRVGKGSVVAKDQDTGKGKFIAISDLNGKTDADKFSGDFWRVTPRDIARWLRGVVVRNV